MKLTINIEKIYAYFIISALVLLSGLIFVVGTGYTAGTPSHGTLFTDILRGKSGATISVTDRLGVGKDFAGDVSNTLFVYRDDIGPLASFVGKAHSSSDSATRVRIKDLDSSVDWFLSAYDNGPFSIHQGSVGDRLSILSNGKVGIGTTSPSAKLHVDDSTSGQINSMTLLLENDADNSGEYNEIRMRGIGGAEMAYIRAQHEPGFSDTSLNFGTQTAANSLTTQMIIQHDGSVGIGTTAPTEKLDVAGNIKASGVCIGSDCKTAWPTQSSGMVSGYEMVSCSGLGCPRKRGDDNYDVYSVACPAGKKVIGGGCSCIVTNVISASLPSSDGTQWYCACTDNTQWTLPPVSKIYAICANV